MAGYLFTDKLWLSIVFSNCNKLITIGIIGQDITFALEFFNVHPVLAFVDFSTGIGVIEAASSSFCNVDLIKNSICSTGQ